MSEFDNINFNNEIANNPVGVPEDQFTFESIPELEVPFNSEAFDQIDPELEVLLANASEKVNKVFPLPTGNYNNPNPSAAMGDYNPQSQQTAPDINTMEGKIRMIGDAFKQPATFVKEDTTFGDPTTRIEDPVISSIAETQFDRYYQSPAFSRLGFHPYRNNEEFYNANSSGWEDAQRMFGQLTKLMGTGYLSSYRSWFEDDIMDLRSAVEYEDAVRIGSSSRGGFGGGLNNFVLNSGYTLGIIQSIAVEELAMWGATAALGLATPATGGASGAAAIATGAAAAARTAFNAKRLATAFRAIGQSFKIGKAVQATRAIVKGLKNMDRAKDTWSTVKAGGNILGKIVAPETMKAFKSLNTAKKAGENLSNMAKVSKTFGGFYRDMRSLNFALSEGRMEGGMVYKEQWARNYLIEKHKNEMEGKGDLTEEQLAKVSRNAENAAYTTTAFNTPLIYLSNQLLLGNAFGGFKRSLNQVLREGIEGVGGRIIRGKAATKIVKEGAEEVVEEGVKKAAKGATGKTGSRQVQKGIYKKVEDSFLNWKYGIQKIKSAGLRGGVGMAGAAALRYSINNISEGLQEVYQEAVAEGVKNYYTSLAFNPLAGGADLFTTSAGYGAKTQASMHGLETFMSGFFMGGLVGGPQKLIFEGLPTLYQKTFNNAEYTKRKQKQDKILDDLVNYMNEVGDNASENPWDIFGIERLNFVAQRMAAAGMEDAQAEGSLFDFIDMKDFAKFNNMFTVFETGKQDFFREQLEDYLKLTDEELAEAFPAEKSRAKSGKLRQSIQGQIEKLDEMSEWFNNNKDKIEIRANPSLYKEGTKERQEENLKYLAEQHAKYLYLFTRDSFTRAGERLQGIYDKLETNPIIKDLAAGELTILLNKTTLMGEIEDLRKEVSLLGDPGSKQAKKKKEKKLALLQGIADVLYDEKNLTGKGSYDRRKMPALMAKINPYLDFLAKTKNAFVDNEMVLDVVKDIVDHNHLSVRQLMYDQALRVMSDPDYIDDLIVRNKLMFKFSYGKKMEMFRESIEAYINKQEINELLNQLANLGVYVDTQDLLLFSAAGDPKFLQTFYNDEGVVSKESNPELYKKIQDFVEIYKASATINLKKEQERKAQEAEAKAQSTTEASKAVDEILKEEGVDSPDPKIYNKTDEESPVLDEVLDRVHSRKRADLRSLNAANLPTKKEFLESDQAQQIITAYIGLKKLWYRSLSNLDPEVRDERYHKDTGFIDWLKLQRSNAAVHRVLQASLEIRPEAYGLINGGSLKLFIPDLKEEQGTTPEDEKTGALDEGKIIDIFEIKTVDEEGNDVSYYRLLDKEGNIIVDAFYEAVGLNPILSGGFPNIDEAKLAREKLNKIVPSYAPFKFDGIQNLRYAQSVKGKPKTKYAGKKYVIISNGQNVEDYDNILVIEESKLKGLTRTQAIKKAHKIKRGDFAKNFSIEKATISSSALPKNVTKLRLDEATALTYHINDRNSTYPEDRKEAIERFQFIIKNLTPEQLSQLEVVITKNPKYLVDQGYVKYEDKEKNPFAKNIGEKYHIALVMPDNVSSVINPKLEEAGMALAKGDIIGYIPNGNTLLFDREGNIIDPVAIQPEQVNDIFNKSGRSNKEAAEIISNNFAVQYHMINSINEKIGEEDSIVLSLEDIGGVRFSTTAGSMDFDSDPSDKKIEMLNVRQVDGVTVVLENTKDDKGNVTTRFITSAERREKQDVEDKIKKEMNEQNVNLFPGAQNTSRYVMIVKSPSGVYSYFPIKSDQLDDPAKSSLADALISRSAQTVKENLEEVEDTRNVESKLTVGGGIEAEKEKIEKERQEELNSGFAKDGSTWINDPLTQEGRRSDGTKGFNFNTNKPEVTFSWSDESEPSTIKLNAEEVKKWNKWRKIVKEGTASERSKLERTLIREIVERHLKEINAKFDAKLAALEQGGGRTIMDVKETSYNSKFNIELNNSEIEGVPGFFIASKPGYDFSINVGANGSIYITAYDRDLKKSNNFTVFTAEEVAEYTNIQNKEKFIDAIINVYNTKLTLIDPNISNEKRNMLEKAKENALLKNDSFKISFDKNVTTNEILDSVTTKVSPNVRKASKLLFTINGIDSEQLKGSAIVTETAGVFTPTEKFTDANGNPIPTGPTMQTSTESMDNTDDAPKGENASLDELTDAEYNQLIENIGNATGALSSEQSEYLAQKLVDVDFDMKLLSKREQKIFQTAAGQVVAIKAQALKNKQKGNAASPETSEAQNTNASLRQQLMDVQAKINERKREIFEETKHATNSEKKKKIENDKKIIDLEKEAAEIESKLDNTANKISDDLTLDDVRHIDEFLEWASSNLPDFITVEDLRTLGDNMKSGGERVGAFVMALQKIAGKEKIAGKIYIGATSKYAYHEAFHSVFRLLLTKAQQEQYYKLAKKEVLDKLRKEGKKLDSELERLRNGDIDKYKNWSRERLEKEYLEEYMADQFETFKQNPRKTKTDSWIKSLFNKILEWIRNVLKRFNGNQLEALYKDISAGKYKSAGIAANPFTDSAYEGVTFDASKLLKYKEETLENGRKVLRYLPAQTSEGIVAAITARVVNLEWNNTDPNFDITKAIEESIDKYKALYNIDNAQYSNVNMDQLDNLINISDTFELFRKEIAEAVADKLEFFDIKVDVIEELDDEIEEQYGLRNTTQFDKDASQNGGPRSLSQYLRKYIGTTTLSEKDEFGNEFLDETTGERVLIPVDFATAYAGFLKAGANETDPVIILQNLYVFAQNNPQTKAVQEKLFNDLGLVWEGQVAEGIIPGETADNLLFQRVIKGFQNAKVDYVFLHTNTKSGQVVAYSAANRDDAHTQVERWETAHNDKRRIYADNEKLREEASKKLSKLMDYINPKDPISEITDAELEEIAMEVSRTFIDVMGIKLHPDYIKYSILNNTLKLSTPYQRSLVSSKGLKLTQAEQKSGKIVKSQKNVLAIEWEAIAYIQEQFNLNKNLMSQSQNTNEGVYDRLRKMALGNSTFDETVGNSVFKNPNGDLVYAHQLPTFHLKQALKLNDVGGNGQALLDMANENPYLVLNHLLNNPAFLEMSKQGLINISRISGSKSSKGIEIDVNDGVIEKYDRDEKGSTYGDFNPKQFISAMLAAYVAGVNPKSARVDGVIPEGQNDLVALAPVLIRVIEASNTGDMMSLPVIKAVFENAKGDIQMTEEALNSFENNVISELNRIQRELNPETATYDPEVGEGKLIVGYNASKDGQSFDPNGRAFSFHNNQLILTPEEDKVQDVSTKKLLDKSHRTSKLRDGSQKIFIKGDPAAKQIGLRSKNQVASLEISEGQSVEGKKGLQEVKEDKSTFHKVKYLGKQKLTANTVAQAREKLGSALSTVKDDTYKYAVKIDNQTFFVTYLVKQWLDGKESYHVYEIVDDNIAELTVEELQAKLKYAEEQEDYEAANEIKDQISALSEDFNFAREIENTLREYYKEGNTKPLSLDEVLKRVGKTRKQLRDFIAKRIDSVFTDFETDVQEEFGVQNISDTKGKDVERTELPSFIDNGLQPNSNSVADQQKFDIANEKLNLKKDRNYNLKQIFINHYINTIAINELLLGDQALTLKNAIDAVKRAKAQNAAYYSAASTVASPKHNVLNPLQKISMFAVTDPVSKSIHTGENIDQADAQNWMTLKAFRYMWFGFGKLTNSQSKLLDKMEAGEDISMDEIFAAAGAVKKQEMINSKKLVYADGKVFDKFSVIPLTKALTSEKDENGNWVAKPGREELHNMRVKMEQYEQDQLDQGVDTVAMVAPLSALKMLKENVTLIDDLINTGASIAQTESEGSSNQYMGRKLSLEGGNTLSNDMAMELDANFMGLQVLNPSNKLEITDPTQIKTLITGEQNDKVEVWINGAPTTIGKVRAAYNRSVAARLTQKYIDKRNLIFDLDAEYAMDQLHKSIENKAITPDLYAFLKYAKTSLMASQSSSQLLEFFSFDEDGNPTFMNAQDMPLVEAKFKQLFLSYFSKSVMAEKIPGTSAALLSDYGFKQYRKVYSVEERDGKTYIGRQEIIRTGDFSKNYSMDDVEKVQDEVLDLSQDDQFDTLKERLKGVKKGGFVIVRDRLRPDMKEYDAKGEYTGIKYSESLLPAHNSDVYELIDKTDKAIPEAVSKMFGIRIPSQDNHSTINIKVVDFLPAMYGSTIVSPRELVEVSGADFDIDKLYIQMKEYYLQDGEFKEYENSFDDYVRYINNKVKKKGSTYAEAAEKAKKRKIRSLSTDEYKKVKALGFDRDAINALRILGLPLTKEAFIDYQDKTGRFPFSAGYNNSILEYKFALMGNENVTTAKEDQSAISYEPADTQILNETWDYIKEQVPELAEILGEDRLTDPNNMRDQWKGFANNKEGARNIGSAVLPNLYLSLVQEVGIKLHPANKGKALRFGGQVYDGFYNVDENGNDRTRELLEDGSPGRRKQYIISALITAMTDNAKDRLAAKLKLSRNALAIVTSMTAMGVPIRTSILLMNHPVIREAYEKESRAPQNTFKLKKFIEGKIRDLQKLNNTINLTEDLSPRTVSQKDLVDANTNKIVSFNSVAELEDALEQDENVITGEQLIREVSILTQFLNAYDISGFLRPLGDIMNLAKGFGVDGLALSKIKQARAKLMLDLTDQEMRDLDPNDAPLFDVRGVFTDKKWQKAMLDIYDEFADNLMPAVFLNETAPFQNIFSGLIGNTTQFIKNEDKSKISKDLLSYVTLKAYMHWLSQNASTILGTPSNTLLYKQENVKDIVDVYEDLKDLNQNRYNFFLDGFIKPQRATDEGNKTGINMLAANTLTPLNDSRKIDLQNGFRELFANPITRGPVMQVLNYMIVKDGLQPVYQSIISAVSPEMFGEYMSILPTASDAFASMSDASIESTFGVTFKELKLEFLKNYFLHPKTERFASNGTMNVSSVFNGRDNIRQSNRPFTLETVRKNKDTLFVIFDNESKSGKTDSKEVRDEENVIRIVIKKDITNTSEDFYTDKEQKAILQQIENKIDEITERSPEYSGGVYLQDAIDISELDALLENSPLVHKTLIERLNDVFNYKVTGLTKKEQKAERKAVNFAAKRKAMYINESGPVSTLIVDLNKGLSNTGRPEFDQDSDFAYRGYGNSDKQVKTFNQNMSQIESLFDMTTVMEGNIERSLVVFPQVVKVKIGNNVRYYQLVRHAGPQFGEVGPGLSQSTALGNYAEYIEVDLMGSSAQTPIGFIFGDMLSTKEIRKIADEANGVEEDAVSDQDTIDKQLDQTADIKYIEYEIGTNTTIDALLKEGYDKAVEAGYSDSFEVFADNLAGKMIIDKYRKAIKNSEEVSFDKGADNTTKIDGNDLFDAEENLKIAKEGGEVASSFNITGTTESTKNDDQGLPGNGDIAKLQAYLDELTPSQLKSLEDLGKKFNRNYGSVEGIYEEYQKSNMSIDEFIEELRNCF